MDCSRAQGPFCRVSGFSGLRVMESKLGIKVYRDLKAPGPTGSTLYGLQAL